MRLGQLARKLEIRSSEIVEFLSRNNIQIEDGSNTRVEDDHTKLVIGHFNPALLIEQEITETVEAQIEVVELAEPEKEATISITEENINPQPVLETLPEVIEQSSSENVIEIIKAPKTELPGLKVLGKIELPEPKKKEVIKPAEEGVSENQIESLRSNRTPRQERRPARNNTKRDEQWKNPIALQREREAREAQEKRKAQLELEKEKRMVHYLKKVKKAEQPVRTARLENEEKLNQSGPKQIEKAPRTWIGKIIRWFSTPTR